MKKVQSMLVNLFQLDPNYFAFNALYQHKKRVPKNNEIDSNVGRPL